MRQLRLIVIPLVALGLQGCVAAVIPLAAAGAMTASVRDNPETPEVETVVSAPRTQETGASSESVEPENSRTLATINQDVAEAAQASGVVLMEGMTDLPTPKSVSTAASDSRVYTEFANYAGEVASLDPLSDNIRQSALLAKPGTLVPDRAPCRFVGNAVLVDLDPADSTFDPARSEASPLLADALMRVRAEGIEVVWSSALTADRAGEVRRWLRDNALDPTGEDRLLLLRYPDDRKQTRRDEAASERCLIAMLGDERADFDELFDYLKRPEAAFALDAILGQGWFLAPVSQPLETNEGTPQ